MRRELSFSGKVSCGDPYRFDSSDAQGSVLVGGVDVIGKLPRALPSALVVLRVCGDEIVRHDGDGHTDTGWGYSSWTPMDPDVWFVGKLDVIEQIQKHEGQEVELCVSWEES